ncbi:MAG: glucosaminidase domain-containing protein [Desulfosudaceae bacterium]
MTKRLAYHTALTFLTVLATAVFLLACQGESISGSEPEQVVGQIELPGLPGAEQPGTGRATDKTGAGASRDSALAWPSIPDKIDTTMPDFSKYTNVDKKKEAFFNFLRPIVNQENYEVLKERAYLLLKWRKFKQDQELSEQEIENLQALAEKYRAGATPEEGLDFFRKMLIRVDKIPVSLALIQAAKESGWGTSYFAREGNNLFGQWCFTRGCGLVPRQRPEGATYEVQAFDDVSDSVRAYIRNLNSHPAYRDLRLHRYRLRLAGEEPDAHLMAGGLEDYSGIGMKYVRTIQQMIRGNEKFMGIHEPADES